MNLKKTYLFTFYLLIGLFLLSGSILINGCKQKSNSTYQLTGDTIADGKNLVQLHCTKCHALVPVDALIKDVWKYHALPSMAHYFGIKTYLGNYYKGDDDTSGLSLQEWAAITSYYEKLAPVSLLPAKPPVPLAKDWAGFKLKAPAEMKDNRYTTLTAFNPLNHKIYTSDYLDNNLTEWDSNLKPLSSVAVPSGVVDAVFGKNNAGDNNATVSCIGRIDQIDFLNGKLINIDLDKKDSQNLTLLASELARPLQTVKGDFNKDGLEDMVVLSSGHFKGGVYLMTQNKDHSYTQNVIAERPGAVQAIAGDFNNDGWTDLMVLFGSKDEGLCLFLNDHKGGFIAKNLLHFPPVYGSTSFQLTDLDHDGNLDLIYTCGYNFHDSRILKPYHGLYIFKNMGNWNFKQQWFYPIDGCTKALTADFNGDGKLDIATIAFFADLQNNPAEGFIYFEQETPFSFKPHAIPVSQYGRWMTMDIADVNGDGKPDVILGNYSTGFEFQPGLKPFWNKRLPFIVLENNFKK
ncbi:FG-GAP repeat domain-containing protein [Mucilaginibacter sp. X4EP1]|jgi:hypothetical protein|uniref:FG-GAP repeat domain-containing protein n=1 Tax=Mucilaginibacter sp. X4EP1 TaxID=2723092 RepID=UPI0021688115|nr:VCBS repeat-containing protein [Mucilaginibacter sp. X4EP1]MCS3812438.1 hypothetical protein [Mucilaginibacter sp. X4EP1]